MHEEFELRFLVGYDILAELAITYVIVNKLM